nr:reverse transcriptase domain-containing protein [Tanacetum cinerariifolium]
MFNSTLIGNARKKYIKDPTELHSIKQQDGESTEHFVRRYKLESRDVKGAPECMRISRFVHGITNPELIKRLHDKILNIVDEIMRVTTSFLRGKVAASNHKRKKTFPPWKQHKGNQKQNFKTRGFRNQQNTERKQNRFSLLTKTPREIFASDKGKFKAPPPMTIPVEKRNHAKFCEFHGEVGHNTDECMHLRKQIKEMLKAGKLSHLIKELKQNNRKEQPKVAKKRETSKKDKALGEDEGAEDPMIIEAKIRGHCIHRIGEIIWPIGQIQLLVKIRDEEHSALVWMNFMVVRSQSPYNGIIRRPIVKKLEAVSSTAHGMLKILVEGGVITLKSSKLVPLECAMVSGPEETPSAAKPIKEERVKVAINSEYPEQTIGRNLEVYVDDLVIKSRKEDEIVRDIEETFKTLREINMKLNPRKCTFGVEEGTFLGYKDVKKLNGKLASLNRFLAKSTEKSLPFFKTLKNYTKKSDFHWNTKAEEEFKQIKRIIAKIPMLTAPMEKEELIVYLAAVKETILSRPKVARRLHKWSIELGEYAIHYRPRVSVKGQILADFIVKRPEEDSPDTPMEEKEKLPEPWILFTDGSFYTDGSGAGLILTNLERMESLML